MIEKLCSTSILNTKYLLHYFIFRLILFNVKLINATIFFLKHEKIQNLIFLKYIQLNLIEIDFSKKNKKTAL